MCDSDSRFWERRSREEKLAEAVMKECLKRGIEGEWQRAAAGIVPPSGIVLVTRTTARYTRGEFAIVTPR